MTGTITDAAGGPVARAGHNRRTLILPASMRLPNFLLQRPSPRQLLIAAASLLGLIVLLLGIAAALIYPTLPDIAEMSDYRPKQPLRVYTADGVQIGEYGAERRRFLPLEQIPKSMQDALLAIEDTGFYEHADLSYNGIARAAISNLFSARSQGASTITQQLARDFYLTKKKLYSRKFIE